MKNVALKYPFSFGVIVFVKNESGTIGQVIDEIAQRIDLQDIFVIDGHSVDETPTIVSGKNVNLFTDNGKGKGAAIQFAIRQIDRDVLVFMDSDGSHQPEEIFALLEPFALNRDVAMVVGSRFKGGSEELSRFPQEIVRRWGNYLSTYIINTHWKVQLTDTQNGFRAVLKSEALKLNLNEDTFAIEQEMTMKLLNQGKKIIEVPSFELKRARGRSHINGFKMLPKYVSNFIRNIFFLK